MNNRILVLGKFLNLDLEQINKIKEIDTNELMIDTNIYKVLTETEANQEFYEFQQEINETNGIDSFTLEAKSYIETNFIEHGKINWKKVNEWLLQQEGQRGCLAIDNKEHVIKFSDVDYFIYLME